MILHSISTAFGRVRRYQHIARWFLRDAGGKFKKLISKVLGVSGLSLLLLLAAIALLFFYLQSLEGGNSLALAGMAFEPRGSYALLLGTASGLLILFSGSTLLKYLAAVWTLKLSRKYEELCAKRVLALAGTHSNRPELAHWQPILGRVIFGSPRPCGRIARNSITLPLDLATFVSTFAILVWLDAPITAVVFILFLLVAPFLYAINVSAARYSLLMEETAPQASGEKRSLLEGIASRRIAPHRAGEELDHRFARGAVRDHLDAFVGRRRVMAESSLVTNLMAGAAVFIVLLIRGSEILATGTGWSELLVYFIALRVNLGSVVSGAQAITSINRFYPQLSRYVNFVREAEALGSPASADESPVDPAPSRKPMEWRLERPRRGEPVGLVVPQAASAALQKASIAAALDLLPDDIETARAPRENDGITLRQAFGFPEGFGTDDLAALLVQMRLDKLLPRRRRLELDMPLGVFTEDKQWPRLRAGLAIAVVSARAKRAAIVEESQWRELSQRQQEAAVELFSDGALVILHEEVPSRPGKWGERFVILTNGAGLLVWADRESVEQLGQRLKKLLIAERTQSQRSLPESSDDEDEDEAVV